ncbi:MAG TPA: RsmG family class I SAM-dependent methyltransferase [Gemmatimonadaceae bacterium]|nr:RsmG family class I SAM-dependent methyltransferase [Gemmatimonadaceae bacterium]
MSLFDAFDLEGAIDRVGAEVGVPLTSEQVAALAAHARAVDGCNERLHLTAIRDPKAFVQRHVGESLVGAALLDATLGGTLVDLGSGNGYPGIPLALARPGLVPVLVESSPRKAEFLSRALSVSGLGGGRVLQSNVQRPSDLEPVGPIAVLATRAMGGWERLLPKLASVVSKEGCLLVWSGDGIDEIARRSAWDRWRRVAERPLPSLERGRVVQFAPACFFGWPKSEV